MQHTIRTRKAQKSDQDKATAKGLELGAHNLIKSQYADFVGDSNNRTEELSNTARVQK